MDNPAQFDRAVLTIVRPGIDGGLSELKTSLEKFWSNPSGETASAQSAQDEISRLIGVFKMVGLDGLSVYCTEIKAVLQELAQHPGMATTVHRETLESALQALDQYLHDIAKGADNATMRLFPRYQELQQLRGLEMSFDLDLFCPNLNVMLPASVIELPQAADRAAQMKMARGQYQQGLVRYLRQTDMTQALSTMQQAMMSMVQAQPSDKHRAYWWVSAGLFSCLGEQEHLADFNAPKLLGRIDQQIRTLLAGKPLDEPSELYQMLYLIANTQAVPGSLIAEIQTAYALQRYVHDAKDIPVSLLSKRLSVIGEHLRGAQDSWEACVAGSKEASGNFVAQTGLLESYCEKLDPDTLQVLARAIAQYAKYALETEYVEALSMDMAMALLLLDRGIVHYHQVNDAFQKQALALSERMHDAVNTSSSRNLPISDVTDLHRDQESAIAAELISKEMLGNLHRVEAGLNAYFADHAKKNELHKILPDLQQIQGGLHMLGWKSAAKLGNAFRLSVDYLIADDKPVERKASRVIAAALSVLESRMVHGDAYSEEQEAATLEAQAKLNELNQGVMSQRDISATMPMYKAQPVSSANMDAELVGIFLEEADEVLAIMRENLELCQLHQDSLEPLITIRRGFHTFKGSGRMVGLNDLGEVAWALERAMNSWLKREQPVTQALINMLALAIPQFAQWVTALHQQGHAKIEADELLSVARQIEENQVPASGQDSFAQRDIELDVAEHDEELAAAPLEFDAQQPQQTPPEKIAAVTAAPEDTGPVQIGSISLSASLFKIGSEESTQHVAILHQQLVVIRAATPPRIEYDFMRAAHTLAGVNRAMGFMAIVDLAFALEAWLQARMEHPFNLLPGQLELLQNTVDTLDRMVQDLCARQFPRASSDMLYLLNMDRDKLHVEEHAPAVKAPPVLTLVEPTPAVVTPVETVAVPSETAAAHLVRDDVDEQLLPVFLEEADELVPKVAENLRTWRAAPADQQPVQMLNRLLHTLKGSARMAGAMRIGQVAHEMEDAVLSAAKRPLDAAYWEGLDHEFDRITVLLEELRSGKPAAESVDVADRRQRATDRVGADAVPDRRTLDIGAERVLQGNMLRVRADVIDHLVNEASEISVARARMESELGAFKEGLLELTDSVTRLRKQLREVEIQAESQMQARVSLVQDSEQQFDPLEFDRFTRLQELTRFMNESVHDVQTVQQALLKHLDETTAAMSAQARLNRELQQSLMNVRMVPFNSITDRLYRIVRQTGKELNKRANLELSGTTVELDRSVLEKMTAPFEHLLRNAMAHGLESEEQRSAVGKQPIGEIRLALQQENNEVVFEFSDNGAGLNFPALRGKAIAQGLLQADQEVSDEQLAQLIFTTGISTASEVTEVAGRGIGMDVVRSEISALGGRIDVSSRAGQGTKFTIHLPLTLAVTQVLMVRCGESIYAIPTVMVEQVRQMKSAEIEAVYRRRQVEWQDKSYPVQYLPQLLGERDKAPVFLTRNSVLLLRSGEASMALHIEELLGNQEAVVKNIGPQLARLPGIAGATVQANGQVVLILNPLQVLQSRYAAAPKASVATVRKLPLVMVVDDSLTVRKITTRMLTRAGYDVVTAKDGVDALEQLVEVIPAVMLLDVEMPRMDGFELTKRMRQDSRSKNIPIIMITSRTADKHRDHALQLGVNDYLGKPYQEDSLLARIAEFVAAQAN